MTDTLLEVRHKNFGMTEQSKDPTRAAVLLSCPGWIMLVAGIVYLKLTGDHPMWIGKVVEILFFVATLICSPISVVMGIKSFRQMPGFVFGVVWILFATFPMLLGLLLGLLLTGNMKINC